MKIRIDMPKPRNPFVALAHGRRGGNHRPAPATRRQKAAQSLRRELATLKSFIP